MSAITCAARWNAKLGVYVSHGSHDPRPMVSDDGIAWYYDEIDGERVPDRVFDFTGFNFFGGPQVVASNT